MATTFSVPDLLRDPGFRRLPRSEQLKGLAETDPNFGSLPIPEQLKALSDPEFLPGAEFAPGETVLDPRLDVGADAGVVPLSEAVGNAVTGRGILDPSAVGGSIPPPVVQFAVPMPPALAAPPRVPGTSVPGPGGLRRTLSPALSGGPLLTSGAGDVAPPAPLAAAGLPPRPAGPPPPVAIPLSEAAPDIVTGRLAPPTQPIAALGGMELPPATAGAPPPLPEGLRPVQAPPPILPAAPGQSMGEMAGGALIQEQEALASPEAQEVFQQGLGTLIPQPAELKRVGVPPEGIYALGVIKAGLAVTTSPEGLGLMLTAGAAGQALRFIANSPRIVQALRSFPRMRKFVDVASKSAVPGAIAGVGAAETVMSAPEAVKAFQEGRDADALFALGQITGGAAIAGLAGRHALQGGRAAVAGFPGRTTEVTRGKPAIPTSAVGQADIRAKVAEFKRSGQNLTAAAWEDLIKAPPPATGPIAEGVKFDSRTVRIERTEPTPTGRAGYRVVDEATGETVLAGTGESVSATLRQRAATKPSGPPPMPEELLVTPREAQRVISETRRRAQARAEGRELPPVAEPRTAQQIAEAEGAPPSYAVSEPAGYAAEQARIAEGRRTVQQIVERMQGRPDAEIAAEILKATKVQPEVARSLLVEARRRPTAALPIPPIAPRPAPAAAPGVRAAPEPRVEGAPPEIAPTRPGVAPGGMAGTAIPPQEALRSPGGAPQPFDARTAGTEVSEGVLGEPPSQGRPGPAPSGRIGIPTSPGVGPPASTPSGTAGRSEPGGPPELGIPGTALATSPDVPRSVPQKQPTTEDELLRAFAAERGITPEKVAAMPEDEQDALEEEFMAWAAARQAGPPTVAGRPPTITPEDLSAAGPPPLEPEAPRPAAVREPQKTGTTLREAPEAAVPELRRQAVEAEGDVERIKALTAKAIADDDADITKYPEIYRQRGDDFEGPGLGGENQDWALRAAEQRRDEAQQRLAQAEPGGMLAEQGGPPELQSVTAAGAPPEVGAKSAPPAAPGRGILEAEGPPPLEEPGAARAERPQRATERAPAEDRGALAGAPSQNVPGVEGGGPARAERPGGGPADRPSAGQPGEPGPAAQPSMGARPGRVGVPAERKRPAGVGVQPGNPGQADNSRDYRIAEADAIGQGGIRQKLSGNLEAIRTLKKIEAEGRPATEEERKALVKYVGWGGMPQAFAGYPREWAGPYEDLRQLLTPEEWEQARASTPNAHYTSAPVIQGIWRALERLGVQPESLILEPSMGVGHFFGLMADSLYPARRTGVEIDPTTGRIAKLLYPDAAIHIAGFEAVKMPENFFDVAVSNVPFGNYGVTDPKFRKTPFLTRSIHNYFFAKALEVVRPGGIVAFITSSYTMDAKDPVIREYLAGKADLLGAIRLPNTAFKATAGTEVTTDIIFLQKRQPGAKLTGQIWTNLSGIKAKGGEDMQVNEYFARHPEMMLGQMALEGTMYAEKSPALVGEFSAEALAGAIDKLPVDVIPDHTVTPAEVGQGGSMLDVPAATTIKEGAFAVKGNEIVVREGTQYKPSGLTGVRKDRVQGMIGVRGAVRDVLRTQIHSDSEAEILKARATLNRVYDGFARKFGYLNEPANARVFKSDPDAQLLLSLEKDWEKDKKPDKADIFTKRTNERAKSVEHVDAASEALAISLNDLGRIDWTRMQELTGRTPDGLRDELAGLIYMDPAGRRWVTADEYLSGNVREKLRQAEAAASSDDSFQRNADALREVQPKDLEPQEIGVAMGAPWIGPTDITQFVAEVLKVSRSDVQVYHVSQLALWRVVLKDKARRSVGNLREYGVATGQGADAEVRRTGADLIEDALNSRTPLIYDTILESSATGKVVEKRVLNKEHTLIAQDKQQILKDKFAKWIWSEAERAGRLSKKYNEDYNNLRRRTFDGSHMTFPGMSRQGLENGQFRPHQSSGAWRILQTGNTLLGHAVGAGKTFTMIAAGMEGKRLGLVKKPMYVVPNHLVPQWSSAFYQLYPSANLFVADQEWFQKGKRQQAMSRIATGNWDAVIVAHSSYGKIPISKETRREFYQGQMDELSAAITDSKAAEGKNSVTVKELEKAKKRLQVKMDKLAAEHSDDNTVTFEELGVDQLFVDEADMFKNLFFVTKMTRLAGLANTESQRAFDMFIKTQYVSKQGNGRGVVFATGTPISNTMAELFTMQRYLEMPYLEAMQLNKFDAWAPLFTRAVTGLELAPEGTGFRMNTRFSQFRNLPELITAFHQVADIQTAEMLKLPVPALKGGRSKEVIAPNTERLKELMSDLAERAERIRQGVVDPRDDNMLKVMSEGRKAALDIRLMEPRAPDDPASKVNRAVENIHGIWERDKKDRLTQLVFADLSTPKGEGKKKWIRGERVQFESDAGYLIEGIVVATGSRLTITTAEGESHRVAADEDTLSSLDVDDEARELRNFNVYQDIKKKLVARGVPETEIAFIHDAKGDAARKRLFEDVNRGRVRVLLGSTEKMGAGMNVQAKLKALHHLDPPWRPRDIEQREGRILRQGNGNAEVEIYTYLTEGSLDAYSWQTLGTKAQFINQAMRGDLTQREIEDTGVFVVTAAEFTALASGNPLIREKVEVDAQVRKLATLKSGHAINIGSMRRRLAEIPAESRRMEARAAAVEADIAASVDQKLPFSLGGKTFTGDDARKEFAAALGKVVEAERGYPEDHRIGKYGPFELWTERARKDRLPEHIIVRGQGDHYASVNEENPAGTVASIEATLRELPRRLENAKAEVQTLHKEKADLAEQVGKPFQQEDKLAGLVKRQRELGDQLDINRNVHQVMEEEPEAPAEELPAAAVDVARIVRDIAEDEASAVRPPAVARRSIGGQGGERGAIRIEAVGAINLDVIGDKLRKAARIEARAAKGYYQDLFGPNGLAKWAWNAWHTPRYIGEKHPAFLPFVDRAAGSYEEREELASRLGNTLQPYFALPADKRKALDARLIDARFRSTSDFETKGLDAVQIAAGQAVRQAMNTALDWLQDLVVDITSGGKITSASGMENEADVREALEAADVEDAQIPALAEKVWKILEEIRSAGAKGYVPFSRFGRYAYGIYPKGGGEPVVHEQRETREAAESRFEKITTTPRYKRMLDSGQYVARAPRLQEKVSREFLRQLGGFEINILAKIAQLNPQFAESMGVSIEELQQFAESIQKLTQRLGFRAHFIESKLTPGFERDLSRPLADYVQGISRHIANAKMFRDFSKLSARLPKNQPKLSKYATDYVDYLRSAPGEFEAFRGLLFHWYLGILSPAAAAINTSQVMMMTAPWLLQYVGPDRVGAELLKAYRDVWGAMAAKELRIDYDRLPEDIRADAKQALEDGTLKAQTAEELYSIAKGRPAGVRVTAEQTSTFLFSGSEHVNRLVSFIAMARVWNSKNPAPGDTARARKVFAKRERAHGLPIAFFGSARDFAEYGVRITQLEYARYNRPRLFRGQAGALLGVFKSFSVGNLELGLRLMRSRIGGGKGPDPESGNWARQKMALLAYLGMFVLHSGLLGLPFAIMAATLAAAAWEQYTGEKVDWEREFHEFLGNLTTPEIGDLLAHGGSWLTPFDFSRSLGMGDPFGVARAVETGELLPSISAALAMPGRVAAGLGELAAGEAGRAIEAAAPRTLRGIAQAQRLEKEGLRTRAGWQMIPTGAFTKWELAAAAAGIPLTKVSKSYEKERELAVLRTGSSKVKSRLVRAAAKAAEANDGPAIKKALADIVIYNKEYKDQIDMETLLRAKEFRMMSPEERRLRSLPKGLREGYAGEPPAIGPPPAGAPPPLE